MRGYRLYEQLNPEASLSGDELDYVNKKNETVPVSQIFKLVERNMVDRHPETASRVQYVINCEKDYQMRNYYDMMIIMRNLLDNAIQCGAEKIMAKLDLNIDEDHLALTIADNGPGMSEEVRSRIFIPRFTTKESGQKDMGLGIYNVRKAVINSCGRFTIDSIPGKGTVCTIYIPLEVALPTGSRFIY